jgi:hypothetical protein
MAQPKVHQASILIISIMNVTVHQLIAVDFKLMVFQN